MTKTMKLYNENLIFYTRGGKILKDNLVKKRIHTLKWHKNGQRFLRHVKGLPL